jgi:restriction system protein
VTDYYRVMLGRGSAHAEECFSGSFIGTDFGIDEDLTNTLGDDFASFNETYIPKFLAVHPGKSRVTAGLACGNIWVASKGMRIGDLVLAPDGNRSYHVGEIRGPYFYYPGGTLPHRRPVRWLSISIERDSMSLDLRHALGAGVTVINVSPYGEEIARLIGERDATINLGTNNGAASTGALEDDLTRFQLEKHLQDFLIANWSRTELGQRYDLYCDDDGNVTAKEFMTDVGRIDILAISKDKNEILVVELKRGAGSDEVVGQVLRYMGYAIQVLAEPHQTVRGAIIALEDDNWLRRALAATNNIDFYRYQVSFKLDKT